MDCAVHSSYLPPGFIADPDKEQGFRNAAAQSKCDARPLAVRQLREAEWKPASGYAKTAQLSQPASCLVVIAYTRIMLGNNLKQNKANDLHC
jgi:hypothetical protein